MPDAPGCIDGAAKAGLALMTAGILASVAGYFVPGLLLFMAGLGAFTVAMWVAAGGGR
jgi:hypothetical protein